MKNTIPFDLNTYVAWRFDSVLPGIFKRNKADFAHHDYPILAPLPTAGRNTPPIEGALKDGPFVYFVIDDAGIVHYVGKSLEKQLIHRWVRPGNGGPASHYWTHSTRSGGNVFEMARGLSSRKTSHYELRYIPINELPAGYMQRFGIAADDTPASVAYKAEQGFIHALQPSW